MSAEWFGLASRSFVNLSFSRRFFFVKARSHLLAKRLKDLNIDDNKTIVLERNLCNKVERGFSANTPQGAKTI